ncbi:MAG: DoxX family protein [bacterium]
MFVAAAIASVLYAASLLFSASGKISKQPQMVQNLNSVGVKTEQFRYLAALLVAAAVGLIIGLWWAPLGIAAAAGAAVYFLLAIGAHVRAKVGQYQFPGAFLLVALIVLVLRIASA